MDSIIRGIYAEERFFRIARSFSLFPTWFFGAYPTSACFDALGVDAVVWIAEEGTTQATLVPVQIKSSWANVENFYLKWPYHWAQRVVVSVVHEHVHDGEIRRRLIEDLKHVRLRHYDYREFFSWLKSESVDPSYIARLNADRSRSNGLRKEIRAYLKEN